MPTVIIAKNQTAGDLSLKSLSAPDAKIPASGQVTLTDYNFVWDIQEDVQLLGYINADSVLLNVDGVDLDKVGSLNAVSAPAMARNLDEILSTQQEPTGFPNRTDSTISIVDGTRTFTIQPAVSSFDFYIAGRMYTKTTAQNIVWDDLEGLHYFYFDDAGVIQKTQTFTADLILKYALVALLYWDFTNKATIIFGDERHGVQMNGQTHLHLHYSFGARWTNGLALQNIVADGDGSLASHAQLAVENGAIRDEDLYHAIIHGSPQTLSPIASIPVYWKSGASGVWRKKTADTFPVIYQGTAGYPSPNRLPYNSYIGGVWGLTQIGNGDFVNVIIFGTNDVNEPMIAVQGQADYGTVAEARAGAQLEIRNTILGGLPTPEIVPVGVVIFQSAGYANTPNARIRSDGTGGTYIDLRRTDLVGVPSSDVTGGIFGAYYQRVESLAESTTTSATYQTKVTLVTGALTGVFRVAYAAKVTNQNKFGKARLYNSTDATVFGAEHYFRIGDGPNEDYPTISGVYHLTLTGTSKTILLQYLDDGGGDTQYIKDAFIEIWRVS